MNEKKKPTKHRLGISNKNDQKKLLFITCEISAHFCSLFVIFVQGSYSPGKPGKVMEF